MLQYQLVFLRIVTIGMIGVIMFISLLFVDGLLQKTKPLKKKVQGRREPRKDRKNMIILFLGMALSVISVFIFLSIKLILRGEI